ncbi:hypothetical protein BC830DRAFT_544756 [Chytriomyces sp. MP71]|nr:hypothetical protein BC830DRAFT_544756 [Chytriomyces sp. MP71]
MLASAAKLAAGGSHKKGSKLVAAFVASLDHLLYVNMANLYLADCALFFLVLRTTTQLPQTPALVAKSLRRTIFFIVGITMIFIVNHYTKTKFKPPVIIDFFGRGHSPSRPFLISADLTIALLQLFRVIVMQSSVTIGDEHPVKKSHTRRKDSLPPSLTHSISNLTIPRTMNSSASSLPLPQSPRLTAASPTLSDTLQPLHIPPIIVDNSLLIKAHGPFELPSYAPSLPPANDRLFGTISGILLDLDMEDVFVGVPHITVRIVKRWPSLLSMPVRLARKRRRFAGIRNEDITVELDREFW